MKKTIRRSLGILLVLMMTLSVFGAAVAVTANAAGTTYKIKIADVTKKYQEAASVLQLCNNYRTGKGLDPWTMDKNLLDMAMVQATELSFYGSFDSPSGKNFLDDQSEYRGKIIGIDVFNDSTVITNAQDNGQQSRTIDSEIMNAAGVGVVEVNYKKYICILAAKRDIEVVPSATLTQNNVKEDQEVEVNPALLGGARLNLDDNKYFYCGSRNMLRLMLINPFYTGCYAMIASSAITIAPENTDYFVADNDYIVAKSPGTTKVKVSLNAVPAINTTVTFNAISKSFYNCTVSSIKNQVYTGSPITPYVTVTDNNTNQPLVMGSDYTVSYSNNINVGTATATLNGLGAYTGSTYPINFKIVDDPSAFKATISLSETLMAVGDSLTVTAGSTNGTSPVKYTFDCAKDGSSSFSTIQASSTASTCTFRPTSAGSYYIRVTAMDNAGKTASVGTTITVNEQFRVNLNLSTSNLEIGKTLSITGTASGGITPYSYVIDAMLPGSTAWTVLANSNSVAAYKPSSVGNYTIRVTATGKTGKTVSEMKTLTVIKPVLYNNSTVSSKSVVAGTTIKIYGSASGGTSPYKYGFYYKKSTSSNWTTIGTEYGTATSASFTPKSDGTYNVKINVKDANNTVTAKTYDITVEGKSDLVNNSYITPPAVISGTEVVVSGAAEKGVEPYKFAYYYKKSNISTWTAIGTEFGSSKIAVFTPKSVATYNIKVCVKDATGTIIEKTIDLPVLASTSLENNSTVSSNVVTSGTSVKLTGIAAKGTAPYKYAYYYRSPTANTWTTIGTEYSTATTAAFSPKTIGTYAVKIAVKDNTGMVSSKTFSVSVNQKSDLVNNSTISSTNIMMGNMVTLTGAASKGTAPYKYAYYYKRTTGGVWNAVGTEFSASTVTHFSVKSAGKYDVKVSVKDSTGTVVDKTWVLTINQGSDVVNNSKISASTITAGTRVVFTGAAEKGTAPYKYAFYYKRSTASNWTLIGSEFGSTVSASMTPSSAGSYAVRIAVKDATGTVAYKNYILTVNPASTLKNNSVISATTINAGSKVTMTGVGADGAVPYQYAFYYRRSTANVWNVLGTEFGTSNTAAITLKNAGTYSMKVAVKDATGTIENKIFTVTVK